MGDLIYREVEQNISAGSAEIQDAWVWNVAHNIQSFEYKPVSIYPGKMTWFNHG